MKINRIGIGQFTDRNFRVIRPNGSGDFDMVLTKTDAFFRLGGTTRRVGKNTLIVYAPNDRQDYGAVSETYGDCFIHFDAEGDDGFLQSHGVPTGTPAPLRNAAEILLLFTQIQREIARGEENSRESCDLLLRLVLIKIGEGLRDEAPRVSPHYDELLSLRTEIYSNPAKKYTVAGMAKSVRLSSSYLLAVYKRAFGVPLMRDVIQSRVEHAQYLLKATGMSAKEIAGICGYRSEEHFLRQFKKATGCTPREYRKS